jgi:hypothetical protein
MKRCEPVSRGGSLFADVNEPCLPFEFRGYERGRESRDMMEKKELVIGRWQWQLTRTFNQTSGIGTVIQ